MTQYPKVVRGWEGMQNALNLITYFIQLVFFFFFSRKKTVIRKCQVVELKSFHENALVLNTYYVKFSLFRGRFLRSTLKEFVPFQEKSVAQWSGYYPSMCNIKFNYLFLTILKNYFQSSQNSDT